MKFQLSIITISLFSLALTACGAGGGRDLGGGGLFCPADQYKSLFKVPKNAEVVTEDPTELGSLDLGEYRFRSAEFMHVKKIEPKNNRRWIMFQVNESADGRGGRDTRRYCARGVQTRDPSFVSEAPGLEEMTVGEGNKVDFSPRLWGFSYNSQKLMLEEPYCTDGTSSCDISEKTFAGKLEPGEFEDASAVLEAYSEVKIVKLKKSKESSVQRYMILARSVYNDENGVENIDVLRVIYQHLTPEQLEAEKEAEEEDQDSDDTDEDLSAGEPED
ncbi:MAG: hypothetical protein AAF202_12405, partial [Pseudomonadota bacterium]